MPTINLNVFISVLDQERLHMSCFIHFFPKFACPHIPAEKENLEDSVHVSSEGLYLTKLIMDGRSRINERFFYECNI